MSDDYREATRWRPTPRTRRTAFAFTIALVVVLVVSIIVSATPWPPAMLIRSVFEKGARDTVDEMQPYVPDIAFDEQTGIVYGDAGADTSLDVIRPAGATEPLPVVVWIHGGAWISGQSSNVVPYLKILAAEGYAGVALNYTLGPEAIYPTAVRQLNDALAYLTEHAAELGIDADRIVLAGDSAGAQLASQLAVLTTNPDYATLVGIEPALRPEQLVGTILNCGVYDLRAMSDLGGVIGWGFTISLWAYTGTKNWSVESPGATMSTIDFVTAEFPPTFISGGNGDGLTWIESVPMSNRMRDAGVDVTSLFWPADHEPALPHEYQFHLDYDEAHTALAETVAFLKTVTRSE